MVPRGDEKVMVHSGPTDQPKLTNCVSALEVLKWLNRKVGENCPKYQTANLSGQHDGGLCALGGH